MTIVVATAIVVALIVEDLWLVLVITAGIAVLGFALWSWLNGDWDSP